MSSLYLKYRPKSFAEVVGQDHIVTTLEHAVDRDQLVHAYLFFGSRGTGKTSLARILAKILLIRGIEDEKLQKQIIDAVDAGNLVDLIEIDAATNRQIDDIRELKEKVQFAPSVASAKVYIIDEVHMMTKEAFNALLKTLEEPPKHVFFILATTELHKVPETIQSRCQRFPFRPIGEEDIVRTLQGIVDRERITADREALRMIARFANGGMRDAISLLDQLSSLEKITEEDIRKRIGESGEVYVERIWEAVDARDHVGILHITSSLQQDGVSLEVFLRQLLRSARDQLHAAIQNETDASPALERIDTVLQALKEVRLSPLPLVVLEAALVRLCLDGIEHKGKSDRDEKKSAVKEARAKLEEKAKDASPAVVSVAEEAGEKKEKGTAEFELINLTRDVLLDAWGEILATLTPASLRMSLKDASVRDVQEGVLTLVFSSAFHRDKVCEDSAAALIEQAIEKKFRQRLRLECVIGAESPRANGNSAAPEEVNLADAAAEIFG